MMLALVFCVALQNPAPRDAGDRGTVQWEGSVERVTPLAGGGVTIALRPVERSAPRRGPGETVIRFPAIPPRYVSALAGAPRRLLTDAIVDRVARIHAYVDERGTQVAAVETRPADSTTYRLDYLAPYFDLIADRRAVHESSLAAAVLSQHPEDMRKGLSIWVRSRIKDALFFYDEPSHAADMIRRFGDERMSADVAALGRVRSESGERTGLIRLQPFVPKTPSDRFVGWWGGFPIEIYVDGARAPERVFARDAPPR